MPKRGGTLNTINGGPDFAGDLDPHTTTNPTEAAVWNNISRGLFQIDATKNVPVPDLATSYEQPDPLTLIVALPNASWENKAPVNGRKLNAGDVKFTMDRIRTNKPGFTRASTIAALDHVEAVDDTHAKLVLKQPSVSLLWGLSHQLNVIVAPEVLNQFGDLKNPASLIGIGPWAVEQFDPQNSITLSRRTDSWLGERPYLDKLHYIYISDAAAALAAYRSGQIHIVDVPPDQADSFKKERPKDTFQQIGLLIRSTMSMRLDGRVPAFQDLRVRQALSLALDRNEANQVFYSGQGKPVATLPWVLAPYATPQDVVGTYAGFGKNKDADRAQAKQLLEAAGQSNLSFEVLTAGNSTAPGYHLSIAQFLEDQFKRIGLNINLNLPDYTTYKKMVDDGNWQATADPFSSAFNPDEHLRLYSYTGASRNYGKYSNPAFDKLVDAEDQEPDVNKRAALFLQAQKILIDDVEHTWIGAGASTVVSQAAVNAYKPTGDYPYFYKFENVWLS